ncbi:MAG: ribosomal protein S18-alanine N-acetyltransferase [Xenococcaceae cyanobacterium MO_188.B32]|nr:ribosomal protein S18-alanine N-acetyltransferase [Xenococcaceae cyanobacterium MO_188.B32]
MKLLTIKPLTYQLLAKAVELDKLCFGGLWSKQAYSREIDSPNSSLLVLSYQKEQELVRDNELQNTKLDQKIIGIGCLWAIVDEAHITLLGIHPHYRGQKLGRLLLYILLQDAVDRQLKRATLEVSVNNQPAISLYQKFGFEIAGKRKNYYPTTGEDALVLWLKGLDRPELSKKLVGWQEQINRQLSHYSWQIEKTIFTNR